VQGSHLPAFDDVDGQIIGEYAAEFDSLVAGNWIPLEDCDYPWDGYLLPPIFKTVHKTGLKVMVKVYQ
jgi:hypothetical protein